MSPPVVELEVLFELVPLSVEVELDDDVELSTAPREELVDVLVLVELVSVPLLIVELLEDEELDVELVELSEGGRAVPLRPAS